jgi:mycothiol system anti-sigma-R factor
MPPCPSDGPSSSLSCAEVIERIYEFLDGELTAAVEVRIRAHLAACRRCYPQFQHERVFLRFLEKRAQIEKAPPALRRRILQKIMTEEGLGEEK